MSDSDNSGLSKGDEQQLLPPRTRRDGVGDAVRPTRRDGANGPSGTRHDGQPAEPDNWIRVELPPELAQRFETVRELLPHGAEAWVLVVRDRADLSEHVLKLYHQGFIPHEGALDQLGTVAELHVVRTEEAGFASGLYFELMEYCRAGSMRELMRARSADFVTIVREIATAIEAVHAVGVVHRDIKPENILIRTEDPLDLVLADFGIVRHVQSDVHLTNIACTRAYAPPEAETFGQSNVTFSWDWWSLGMIALEHALGYHYFSRNGMLMEDRTISYLLSQGPVDVSRVTDPRLRLLCAGLLTSARDHRWGYEEVKSWVDGGSPAVWTSFSPQSARTTVWFADAEHSDSASVGAAMLANWSQAAEHLFQVRHPTLVEELDAMLLTEGKPAARKMLAASGANPYVLVGALLFELVPSLTAFPGGARGLSRQVTAALDLIDNQLPDHVRRSISRGAVLSRLVTLALDTEAQQAAHGSLRALQDRRGAEQRPWWMRLASSSERSPSHLALAEATFELAIAEERARHDAVRQQRGEARQDTERRSPLPWVFALLGIGGLIVGGIWVAGLTGGETQSATTPQQLSDSAGAAGDTSPLCASTFAPEFGLWGDYPCRSKEAVQFGSAGDAVKYLQSVLNAAAAVQLEVDGQFGPTTNQAVIDMQTLFRLPATGVVDAATWEVVDFVALDYLASHPPPG